MALHCLLTTSFNDLIYANSSSLSKKVEQMTLSIVKLDPKKNFLVDSSPILKPV